jgi:proline dehydrogenase
VKIVRKTLLWASRNQRLESLVRSSRFTRPLVARFLPGETLEDAAQAADELYAEGTPAIFTYLGENVSSEQAADETLREYERLFAIPDLTGARSHVSVKLTQFGWDLDRATALSRVRTVAEMATDAGTVLAVDMESSEYVDSTVDAYATLRAEFSDIALCLQAYLHRTPRDVERLAPLAPYIRLVKGAYREPTAVALQGRPEISARYRELGADLLRSVAGGARVAFGTHDADLIRSIQSDAARAGVAPADYEIQMLYGVQAEARRRLARDGAKTRVLISYGRAWYAWFMRRLAEKPSNLLFVVRGG